MKYKRLSLEEREKIHALLNQGMSYNQIVCSTAVPADTAIDYIHFLIDQSEKHPENLPIIIIAHSEGAMIAEFAVKKLKPSIRKKIQFWTFGGAGFVPDGICHSKTCNYITQHDPVVQAVSAVDSCFSPNFLLIKKKQDKRIIQDRQDLYK
jgi:hypothetical protein